MLEIHKIKFKKMFLMLISFFIYLFSYKIGSHIYIFNILRIVTNVFLDFKFKLNLNLYKNLEILLSN